MKSVKPILLLIVFLCTGVCLMAQALDDAGLSSTGAAGAYSTRLLRSGYAGAALNVRRASDNAQADVSFDGTGNVSATSTVTITNAGTSGLLVGATLSFGSFYSGTTVYVTTWYDQSGNSRNITQATTSIQPTIVNAGSPVTISGKMGISLNGTNATMNIPLSSTLINAQGSFSTVHIQSTLQNNFNALLAWSNGSASAPGFGPLNSTGAFGLYTTWNSPNLTLGPVVAGVPYVLNATWTGNGSSVTESRNGVTISGSLGSNFSQTIATGFLGHDATSYFSGTVSEVIIFSSPLSAADRQSLQSNQGTAFGISLLPLHLINFDGTKKDDGVELKWQTAEEINTAFFTIERSNDDKTFNVVGQVAAKGTGSNVYSFVDVSASASTRYYRLKITDEDGRYTYSSTVVIAAGSTTAGIILYPNPAKDHFTLEISNPNLLHTSATLTDVNGKQVAVYTITEKLQQLDISTQPAGIYFLLLNNGQKVKVVKMN